LDWDTYKDDGNNIIATRVTDSICDKENRKRIVINRLEVECEAGVGLSGSATGSDPQIMLRVSKDGGHSWGNERWRSMGKIGEYKQRAIWNRLGVARDWRFQLSISDPIKRVILTAFVDAELLMS
jgi:hypothetical protein